jgi:predicted metal-dependent phosphoesterase TrpH
MTSQSIAPFPAQDLNLLRQVFGQIDAQSCPNRYNFHNHTNCSDGKLTPQESMAQAIEIGLEDMAITDHHSVRGYQQAQAWLAQQSSHLRLWIGTEITAYIDNVDIHILGFGFDPHCIQLAPYLQGREADRGYTPVAKVIAAIHAAKGLAVLAHPSRYRLPTEQVVATVVECGIDGLEAYYAYKHTNPWAFTIQETDRVLGLIDRYGLFATCGTDTHGTNLRLRL